MLYIYIKYFILAIYLNCATLIHYNFFNFVKKDYTSSPYLGLTGKLRERKQLVKFGIGNHKLRIETGRYDHNRLGTIFESNHIEDESLFLMCCINYSILGDEFYSKIGNIVPTFKLLSPLQAIGKVMTSTNHYVKIQLVKFISFCSDIPSSNQTDVT